jgi:hypothetical protein
MERVSLALHDDSIVIIITANAANRIMVFFISFYLLMGLEIVYFAAMYFRKFLRR